MKSGKKLFEKIQIKQNKSEARSPYQHQKLSVQFKPNFYQNNQSNNLSLNQQQYQQIKNQSKNTLQQNKISEINKNFNHLSSSIGDLKSQYRSLKKSQKQISSNKKQKSPENQKLKQFIAAKRKERIQREKKMQKSLQIRDIKIKQAQQQQMHEKEDKKVKKIQQIRKLTSSIKQNTEKKKQQSKQKLKVVQQIYKKYKNKVPLFEIKEKQDEQHKLKKEIQIKQIISKRKQVYKPLNMEQLSKHEKQHDDTIGKLMKQKQQEKIKQLTKIVEGNSKMKNLYRGRGSENYIQEIAKQQEKKQIPFRIREKIKDYEQHIKQNFLPKHPVKRKRGFSSSLDLKVKRDQQSTQSFRQIRRYKYIHGVSYGSVLQTKASPKSHDQQKKIGNGYMQFMKNLPKKKLSKNQGVQISMILKNTRQNPLKHNRKKSKRVHLNDQPTREQINMVLLQLKNYDKKINEKQKLMNQKSKRRMERSQIKEIDQDLLLNIEKKMNLLHKLQTQ